MGTQIARAMRIGSAQRPAPGVNVTLASAVGKRQSLRRATETTGRPRTGRPIAGREPDVQYSGWDPSEGAPTRCPDRWSGIGSEEGPLSGTVKQLRRPARRPSFAEESRLAREGDHVLSSPGRRVTKGSGMSTFPTVPTSSARTGQMRNRRGTDTSSSNSTTLSFRRRRRSIRSTTRCVLLQSVR